MCVSITRKSLPFKKFILAYHHYFGKQCRVYDYGFTKLLELFEAIPHVVDVSTRYRRIWVYYTPNVCNITH